MMFCMRPVSSRHVPVLFLTDLFSRLGLRAHRTARFHGVAMVSSALCLCHPHHAVGYNCMLFGGRKLLCNAHGHASLDRVARGLRQQLMALHGHVVQTDRIDLSLRHVVPQALQVHLCVLTYINSDHVLDDASRRCCLWPHRVRVWKESRRWKWLVFLAVRSHPGPVCGSLLTGTVGCLSLKAR